MAGELTVRATGQKSRSGFTLVEVLVALVVVAVALGALAHGATRSLDHQYRIERQTLALWMASNQLAELELEARIEPGTRSGTTRMADRDWRWETRIEPAPGEELWRIDVTVFDEAEAPLITHSGFLPR